MANTLTALIPKALAACQEVFSEKASMVANVDMRYSAIPAALNEVITIPTVPTVAGGDRTPAMVPTIAGDRSAGSTSITITKDRKFPFHMTGDDYLRIRQNPEFIPESLKQAFRTARNEIHSDLADQHVNAAGYYSATGGSSGAAAGTGGTTPFATTIGVLNLLDKQLNDALAPADGRNLMVDTTAKQALGDLGLLQQAHQAGDANMLRRGIVGPLVSFNVMWDQVVKQHTAGTGATYQLNGAHAAGATTIAVDTGTGTILAGDVVAIAGILYVVATALSGGSFTITSGLVGASADNVAVTVHATSRRNLAWHRDAIAAVVRPPAMPPKGDMARDATIVTDPVTGVSMRLAEYVGYGLDQLELQVCWGVKTVRADWLKILLG